MAYDPTTDVDPGYDIEGHTAADDDMGQQEQREQAAVTPRFRPTAPGVLSPTPAPTPQRQGITPPQPRTNYPPAEGTYTLGDDSESYGFTPSAAAPGPVAGKNTWKDWGDQLVTSALGSAGALASGVSWVQHQINSDPQYRSYADDIKDFAEKHVEATLNGMSDHAKATLRASLFGGDRDAEGNAIPSISDVGWGSYIAMHAIGMIPDGLAMLLPGGILGKVAVKGLELAGGAARAIKAGEEVATLTKAGETAHAIGHAAGTGGYFSLENGGEMAATINNEIDKAPDLDLQSGSDVYKHLRDSGMGVDQAKAELKKQSTMMTVGAFAAGAVGGAGFGVLGKGVVRGAIAGAGAMGIQGGATQALQQGAEKAMGTRQDYDLGSIMSDTLTSGAGGLLLGGIGGRFAGRDRAPPKPGVDPDVDAALTPPPPPPPDPGLPPPTGPGETPPAPTPGQTPPPTAPGELPPRGAPGERPPPVAPGELPPGGSAAQGGLDLSVMPPGSAGASQGEMFRSADQANQATTPGGLAGAPAPTPPPGPVSSRAGGMPGAQQEGLPINQTPPTIVPTTGQGEMFPSLPEANPPVQGATVPMTEARGEQPPPAGTPPAGAPPAGEAPAKPTSAAERKRALVAELTGKPGAPSVTKLRRGKIADLEKMRDQLNATQPDTTVVSGADRAPASETLARQGPSETAAPPVSGEALTPPVTPEGVQKTTPAAKPAATTTTTPTDTTGLAGMGGKMAGAISKNLRDMLWAKHEAGDTTEAGKPSNILRASTYLKDRGVITDRASFEKFLDDYGAAQKAGELKTKAGADKFFEKQLTGQEPAPEVRPEGEPSPDAMAKSGEGIAPETKAEAAVKVSKARGRPKKVPETVPEKVPETVPKVAADTEAEQNARDDAYEKLANVRQVVAKKVPRGTPVEGLVNKAFAEIQTHIDKTDGTTPQLMEVLHDMAQPREGDVPNEYAMRYGAASSFAAKLGEKLPRIKTVREDARSELEQIRAEQEERQAGEATARATSGEAIEEKAAAGETTKIEAVHRKKPKGTDTVENSKAILNKLLDPTDPMDLKAAEADYNKKSKTGQPRREGYETLLDVLHTELKRVTDPDAVATAEKLRADLAKNDQMEPHTREGSEARQIEEDKRDTKSKQILDKLADYEPSRVSKIIEHIKELSDPVAKRADTEAKMAADKAARLPVREQRARVLPPLPRRDGIPPMSSEYIKAVRDPTLNKHLMDHVDNAEFNGGTASLHNMLDAIINHAATKQNLRPLWEMARRMRALVGDIPVVSPEAAHSRGWIPTSQYMDLFGSNRRVSGYHSLGREGQAPEHIVLNSSGGWHTETLLHETMHQATTRYIDRLLEVDPNHPHIEVLRAIGRELRDQVNKALIGEGYLKFHHDLEGFSESALVNPHEVHAWLMTNSVLQDFAARTVASPEFRARMAELGYGPRPQGRSVWRAFTDWVQRALGYNKPESASETAFLDHILRPLQDITEEGAKYNAREAMPTDPVLRAQAEPVFRTMTTSMGPRAREAINHVDPAGLWDRVRRKLLVATGNDAIHDWNKDILPSLTRWRTANENISAASNEFAGKYGDRVQALNERINKADDKNSLSNLMVNVGVHESHIGENLPADANAHLTTPEQLRGLHEDQAAYRGLSTKDKAIYNDTKKLYNEMYGDERKATARSIVNAFTTGLTDAQKDAFTTGVRSQASLERFMADPDNSDIARAFGPDWANKRSIVTNMAKLHALGFVRGDYFPLRRFGNYVVSYGDRADLANYGVEMFDSYTKAQERRAELVRQGHTDVNQVAKKDDTHMGDIRARPAFADELASELRRSGADAGHIEHVTDLMNDMLLRHATQSEAARARLRRRGVKGASTDATRVLSAEFLSKQSRYGYLLHGLDRAQRLNDIHDEAKAHEGPSGTPGAAVRAMSVYQEIAKRMTKPEDHDNLVRKVSGTLNSFSFMQNLMSVSHMLTSTMETHGNSLALLGARHGYASTSLALIRAMKDASPAVSGGARNAIKALGNRLKTSDWNLVHAVVEEMASKPGVDGAFIRMLGKEAVRTGLIDHTILQDIRQQMSPAGNIGTGPKKLWNMFYNSNAAMAHSVDVMNKLAVLKAAGELELRKNGGDRQAAMEYAIQMTRRVMPNYTTANRSRLASNPIAGTLLQFKRYGMHMYELMGNLARESVHGENKWEARKQLAGLLATHSAMAGTFTLIADPLRYIGGAYDLMSGRATTSGFHDYQNDARNWASDTFGPELADVLTRGIPHALGFDTHLRTGMANLLEVPEMNGFNKAGAAQVLLGLTTGAAGESLQNMVDGVRKGMSGDLGGAFKDMAPRPFRDAWKGYDIATNGIRDSKGKVILPPEKVGVAAGITQALGFQPANVERFREGRAAVREAQMEQKADRTQLTSRWLAADPADRPAVMSEIRQFNADPTNVGARIQVSQLLQQLHQRQKDTHAPAGAFGLRMPKKGAQPLMDAGRFANG